jgi:hypothetical protein
MAYHGDNAVKAYVKYDDGSNSIDDSFNISSVTNHATGQITVNFSTNMSSNIVSSSPSGITQTVRDIGILFCEND